MKLFKTLALATFAVLGSAAQAGTSSIPTAITFDGYCDGLSNITVSSWSVVQGDWDLSACGSSSYPFVGIHGCARDQKGVTGHYDDASGAGDLLVRVNGDGTWVYLDAQGNVFNHGTWTDASEGGARGARVSTQR